ncbi:plasmid partitioning protein RepB C-terminal domain-containing protein [Paraburkholderia unamae]|uniref:Plasmid partitioning protein RepB C-terminal domain-containing protein n=1 Tax=Paraburkholderia unamae TaxID=219649 RepID=A0ACC6RTT5_9BURK
MNDDGISGAVELIAIDHIRILNPRARNRRIHQEIIRSIESVGLKRPITVCRTSETQRTGVYDLVCGQGRLEAYTILGQKEIPAHVITATERECLVKSLVENIARRQARPIEVLDNITILRHRGYSNAEIGRKIGCSAEWVKNIGTLLDKGEKRLLSAAEAGLIPLSLAVDIARAPDAECQSLLMEAYNRGELRGRKVTIVRRLLELRARSGKAASYNVTHKPRARTYKPDELRKLYEREAARHRVIIRRAEFTQGRLMGVIEAFRDLLNVDEFVRLLSEEKRNSMPEFLKAAVLRRDGGAT